MHLTDVKVRKAKPLDKPYKLAYGGSLYLLINPNGSRYWRMKYRVLGRESYCLSVFILMPLAMARQK